MKIFKKYVINICHRYCFKRQTMICCKFFECKHNKNMCMCWGYLVRFPEKRSPNSFIFTSGYSRLPPVNVWVCECLYKEWINFIYKFTSSQCGLCLLGSSGSIPSQISCQHPLAIILILAFTPSRLPLYLTINQNRINMHNLQAYQQLLKKGMKMAKWFIFNLCYFYVFLIEIG